MTLVLPWAVSRTLAVGTVLALSCTSALAAAGGCGTGMQDMSRISVTGTGQSRVAPDLATVQVGVSTQADSATAAMEQNATRQTAVIDALSTAGIAASDIQTSGLNLTPMMAYPEGGAPTVSGYQATNTVMVRVVQLDRLGQVLDAIVGAGANEINGISFAREDAAEAEDQARREAVADARRKAEVLAQAAGLRLGGIMRIGDSIVTDAPQPLMMMRDMAAESATTPVAPGQVNMSVNVQIDFALTGADAACAAGDDAGAAPRPRGKPAPAIAPGQPLPPGHPPIPADMEDMSEPDQPAHGEPDAANPSGADAQAGAPTEAMTSPEGESTPSN